MSKVFLNGDIIEDSDARIACSDSGFLYGIGLFETMRCAAGTVFALEDHMDRLFAGAKALDINNPHKKDYYAEVITSTLAANDLTDARIRLTLTNGPMNADPAQATVLITANTFEPYPQQYYDKGVAVTLSDYRQNPSDPTTGHKTTSFFARLAALAAAHKKGAAEALWFTPDGLLAEGSVSNVFLVKDATLYTPTLQTPVLAGVARKHVLLLADKQNIKFVEKDLTITDLLAADEVFITNVIMAVMPVMAVESHTVADGKPGPIAKGLLCGFNGLIGAK